MIPSNTINSNQFNTKADIAILPSGKPVASQVNTAADIATVPPVQALPPVNVTPTGITVTTDEGHTYLGPPVTTDPPISTTGSGTTATGSGSSTASGSGVTESYTDDTINNPGPDTWGDSTHTYLGPPVSVDDGSGKSTTTDPPATTLTPLPATKASISPWLIIIGIGIGLYLLTGRKKRN